MSLIGSFPFYCIIRICEDLNICTVFHIFTFDIVVLYDKLFFFFPTLPSACMILERTCIVTLNAGGHCYYKLDLVQTFIRILIQLQFI